MEQSESEFGDLKLDLECQPNEIASVFSADVNSDIFDLADGVENDDREYLNVNSRWQEDSDLQVIELNEKGKPAESQGNRRVNYRQLALSIIDSLCDVERHLFNQQDLDILTSFKMLGGEAQSLYLQLFQRKHSRIPVKSLRYYYIKDIDGALKQLTESREFAVVESVASLDEIFSMASLEKIRSVLETFYWKKHPSLAKTRRLSKPLLLTALKDFFADSPPAQKQQTKISQYFKSSHKTTKFQRASGSSESVFIAQMRDAIGDCVLLNGGTRSLFHRLFMLFFRHRDYEEKPLTTYILAQTQLVSYAHYAVERSALVFQDRESTIAYQQHLEWLYETQSILPTDPDSCQKIMALFKARPVLETWESYIKRGLGELQKKDYYLRAFNPGYPLTRALEYYVALLERNKLYKEAVLIYEKLTSQSCFRLHKLGRWFERWALIEMRYLSSNDLARSLDICKRALTVPYVLSGDLLSLGKRIRMLEKKIGILRSEWCILPALSDCPVEKINTQTFYGRKLSSGPVGKNGTCGKSQWQSRVDDSEKLSVEQYALQCYAEQGYRGYHSENTIFTTIFGILFWDILFQSRPGVLEHAYQLAPLDLLCESFYLSRRDDIEAHLAFIGSDIRVLLDLLCTNYGKYRGLSAIHVVWDAYSMQDLVEIATGMGAKAISQICRLFSENYKQHTSGMPDLCLWQPELKKTKFAEVKGPGDRVSSKQQLWFDVLRSFNVDIELCLIKDGPK